MKHEVILAFATILSALLATYGFLVIGIIASVLVIAIATFLLYMHSPFDKVKTLIWLAFMTAALQGGLGWVLYQISQQQLTISSPMQYVSLYNTTHPILLLILSLLTIGIIGFLLHKYHK